MKNTINIWNRRLIWISQIAMISFLTEQSIYSDRWFITSRFSQDSTTSFTWENSKMFNITFEIFFKHLAFSTISHQQAESHIQQGIFLRVIPACVIVLCSYKSNYKHNIYHNKIFPFLCWENKSQSVSEENSYAVEPIFYTTKKQA